MKKRKPTPLHEAGKLKREETPFSLMTPKEKDLARYKEAERTLQHAEFLQQVAFDFLGNVEIVEDSVKLEKIEPPKPSDEFVEAVTKKLNHLVQLGGEPDEKEIDDLSAMFLEELVRTNAIAYYREITWGNNHKKTPKVGS